MLAVFIHNCDGIVSYFTHYCWKNYWTKLSQSILYIFISFCSLQSRLLNDINLKRIQLHAMVEAISYCLIILCEGQMSNRIQMQMSIRIFLDHSYPRIFPQPTNPWYMSYRLRRVCQTPGGGQWLGLLWTPDPPDHSPEPMVRAKPNKHTPSRVIFPLKIRFILAVFICKYSSTVVEYISFCRKYYW